MVSRQDFRDLIQTIVAEEIPDEEFMFDVEGDDVIAKVFAGDAMKHSASGAAFELIDSHTAQQVVHYIPVISSTFTVINTIITTINSNRATPRVELTKEMSQHWYDALVAAGLSTKKARTIVDRFAEEVITLAEKKIIV